MRRLLQLTTWVTTMLLICIVIIKGSYAAGITGTNVKIHYFYSPTCASCQETDRFFNTFLEKHPNTMLKKHNIAVLKEKSLLNKYNALYQVTEKDAGMVPVLFVGDRYLTGGLDIIQQLDSVIVEVGSKRTLEVTNVEENHDRDMKLFVDYRLLGVFAAGVLNGINPCALSMLLFFASMLSLKKISIIKAGISYSAGKYLSFLLLGTLLFNTLEHINLTGYFAVLKGAMLLIFLVLTALNINDYIAAKNERYSNIWVQLPLFLRKFNHNIIKKISGISNTAFIPLVSFIIGIIIALGEFLCTGQIYLATIVTILNTSISFNYLAFIYLLAYDFGFIIPALALMSVIYKGKEIFNVSEKIRSMLPLIKLANAFIFILFCILLFML